MGTLVVNGTSYTLRAFGASVRPLTADEREKLRRSLRRSGMRQEITIDERRRVVDGNNRLEIAAEIGIKPRICVLRGKTDEQLEAIAVELNASRRHMTRKERESLYLSLREQGLGLRAAAAEAGISKGAAQRVGTVPGGTVPTHKPGKKAKGKDGAMRPIAKRTHEELSEKRNAALRMRSQGQTQKAVAKELGVDRKTLRKWERSAKSAEESAEPAAKPAPEALAEPKPTVLSRDTDDELLRTGLNHLSRCICAWVDEQFERPEQLTAEARTFLGEALPALRGLDRRAAQLCMRAQSRKRLS